MMNASFSSTSSSTQQQQQQQQQEAALFRAIAASSIHDDTIAYFTPADRQAAFFTLQEFQNNTGNAAAQRVMMALSWLRVPRHYYNSTIDITISTKLLACQVIFGFLNSNTSKSHNNNNSSNNNATNCCYADLSVEDRCQLRRGIINGARLLALSSSNDGNTNTNKNTATATATAAAAIGTRILGKKLAAVLEGIVARDFPQRWTTFTTEVFAPLFDTNSNTSNNTNNIESSGGLWLSDLNQATGPNNNNYTVGIEICLECLKLLAEDCTDSDFNSKMSTQRRNDVLIGLNEVAMRDFLPHIYRLLEQAYPKLQNCKQQLHQMHTYLSQYSRTVATLTLVELHQYQTTLRELHQVSQLLSDALVTLSRFCGNMPVSWILGTTTNASTDVSNGSNGNNNNNGQQQQQQQQHQLDFVAALLHLLREPYSADTFSASGSGSGSSSNSSSSPNSIQLRAVECLEQLALRSGKLDYTTWMQRLLAPLPTAISDANAAFANHFEFIQMAQRVGAMSSNNNDNAPLDPLTLQLDFHRALARMLPIVVSSHLALINTSKSILNTNNNINNNHHQDFEHVQAYLQLLVQLLHHPSGRICCEQINMWVMLMRDPQITKAAGYLLQPHVESILTCYMQAMVRIPWDTIIATSSSDNDDNDINNAAVQQQQQQQQQLHPHAQLLEASFDGDEDEYDAHMADLRSRTSLLFKLLAHIEPAICASVLLSRVQQLLLQHHGNDGITIQSQQQPLNNLDPRNQQLTLTSDAVLQWEGLAHPLENIMAGIPAWALHESNAAPRLEVQRRGHAQIAQVRASTIASCAALAQALVVTWNPSRHVWLKFRRATVLESLKYYWKWHPVPTLLQGIDALIGYLGLPEEWNTTTTPLPNNGSSISSPGISRNNNNEGLSGEMISLKKRSGIALVAVAKHVPNHLVPWLSQLSNATGALLSSPTGLVIPMNQMHLYEFLSCVATAVDDPVARANFIANVLSHAVTTLESVQVQEQISSSQSLLASLGVIQAADSPTSVTDQNNVQQVTDRYGRLFTALNQLLSVGRRCNEAARQRSGGVGVTLSSSTASTMLSTNGQLQQQQQNFPDEGPLSIQELSVLDPFAPLWPRIITSFLNVYQSLLGIWRPEQQAILLRNPIQRYTYAISDDEVFVSRSQNGQTGGVFGEGGTAGSVVAGADRRDCNLVPKWSGWLNELRNTCFQMFGLLAKGRALFAPELAKFYPTIVSALIDPVLLKSMEHRHLTQFLKHIPEVLLTSCPSTLYATHLGPILGPLMEHVRYRLEHTWSPILSAAAATTATRNVSWTEATRAVTSNDAMRAAEFAARSCGSSGGDEWFVWNYGHAGLFVGDLDFVTAEAVVEKHRVDVTHAFVDMVQVALALKGDWALVLANQAKEEQSAKRNDASKLMTGPASSITDGSEVERNANGTAKHENQAAIDARKLQRIDAMSHFLLLENEGIAGNLSLTVIQCLGYPDAYTVRRTTKVCHRILETVAWSPHYAEMIGDRMFRQVLKNIVTEPKWMVGIEWDMINVMRDIYCRCVLGQTVQPGGQGTALQQPILSQNYYEQAKTVGSPLQGGGILQCSSDSPRRALTSIPGITVPMVEQFESDMKKKRSAKDQKDFVRDLLRIASDNVRELTTSSLATGGGGAAAASIFDRAEESESFLSSKGRPSTIPALPEKLVTLSQIEKKKSKQANTKSSPNNRLEGLAAFDLF